MPFELLATYLKLPVFALVAARLGGLLMFQPCKTEDQQHAQMVRNRGLAHAQ